MKKKKKYNRTFFFNFFYHFFSKVVIIKILENLPQKIEKKSGFSRIKRFLVNIKFLVGRILLFCQKMSKNLLPGKNVGKYTHCFFANVIIISVFLIYFVCFF